VHFVVNPATEDDVRVVDVRVHGRKNTILHKEAKQRRDGDSDFTAGNKENGGLMDRYSVCSVSFCEMIGGA
jgi:hypothetical protein